MFIIEIFNDSDQPSGNGFQIDTERIATRNGTTYTMNTANIGKHRNLWLYYRIGLKPIR
jgi:hypothetical protein